MLNQQSPLGAPQAHSFVLEEGSQSWAVQHGSRHMPLLNFKWTIRKQTPATRQGHSSTRGWWAHGYSTFPSPQGAPDWGRRGRGAGFLC